MWILGPDSFKVIDIYGSQMQALTVMLTNKTCTFTIQIPSVVIDKLEPIDDSEIVLLDSKNEICAYVDLSSTSPFPFRSANFIPSQLSMHATKISIQSYV